MKLNLLNLLKATVLKAGAIKTIAPATEFGSTSDFKRVLLDVQSSLPPGLTKEIRNVNPPVEESAVLISKRYSKSHVETQDKVKESVKSEKRVEQVAQSVLPISPLLVVALATGAAVPKPKIVQSPPEVKQLPLVNRVVNKAESVVSTPQTSRVALIDAQNDAPVQRSGDAVVVKQTLTNRPVETQHTRERAKAPSPQSTQRVTPRDQMAQSPILNRPSDKRAAPELKEVAFVRSPNTVGVDMSRESRPITVFVQRPAAETVKQELTSSPQGVSSAKKGPETFVPRDSDGQKYMPKSQEAVKTAEVVRPITKGVESLSKSGNKQDTTLLHRGDATHVERVAVKLADTAKEVRSETSQQVSNQSAPVGEKVGAPIVPVSKPRLVSTESVCAELPQQIPQRPTPIKGKVDMPMVRVTEPRITVPVQVNHFVQDNERPRVVQQVWVNDIVRADVKPTRTENTSLAKETQTSYKPQVQSKLFPNVDSAFIRPTLEANVLKQPTLAEMKLNAAVPPRVILKPEHVRESLFDKQAYADPLQKAMPVVGESRTLVKSILTTAPRNVPKAENSEQNRTSKKAKANAGSSLITKIEHAHVAPEHLRPLQPEVRAEKPIVKKLFTPESILKRETAVEVRSLEANVKTETPQNARQNIQRVMPETIREQSPALVPLVLVPEFELPQQTFLSASVNEPVRESLQTETSPANIEQKPIPITRIEPKLEARLSSLIDTMKSNEGEAVNPKTPVAAKTDAPETFKDNATSARSFKPLASIEPLMQSMPKAMPVQTTQELGPIVTRIDTTKAPEFMRNGRASVEREEQTSRSTQERLQQVSEVKQSEQLNHNGQDAQSRSHERESGQPAVRQTIEQATQTSTHASISKSNHPSQSAANESLKLALQKALDQSRKRMIDPDELRMSIPFGELGTMDIDIVREAEKFSIRIAADPQAIAIMEDQRIQLTQWLRVQGYPVEQIDITPRFGCEQKSDLAGSNQSTEERSSGEAGQFGHQRSGVSGAGEEHAEAAARPAFSGLRVWTA